MKSHPSAARNDCETSSSIYYDLHGLTLEAAECIPGLVPAEGPAHGNAVRIEFGAVPLTLHDAQFDDGAMQANASAYLFVYPGVLRLLVEGDRRIVVERLEDCDPVRLWTQVLGMGVSIAGFRRGFLPIHASSILTESGCVAFAGPSGAGKSTLAASLIERGLELFTDDLCLLQCEAAGKPFVGRGVPELRLWYDAVEALRWSDRRPFAVQPNLPKSVFRLHAAPARRAPLRRIYFLVFDDEIDETAGIRRIEGMEALQALLASLRMRIRLLSTGDSHGSFMRLTNLCDGVEMFRFVRPRDHRLAHRWLDRLVDHLEA